MRVESYLKKGLATLFFLFIAGLFSGCNWFKTYYTISYVSEYGKTPESVELLAGSTLTVGQTKALRETGHTFNGWYEGDVKAEAGIYVVTHDATLVAHWDLYKYSITYYLNGGDESEKNSYKKNFTIEDETFELPIPTRDHYDFVGWFDKAQSDEDSGKAKQITEIKKGTTGNINCYAYWIPHEYSIKYILPEDCTNSPDNPSFYTEETVYYTFKPADSPALGFLGWFKENDPNSERVYTCLGLNYEDATLYGLFAERRTIYYKCDYCKFPEQRGVALGAVLGDDYLPNLTVDNMIFIGWYTDSSYSEESKISPGKYTVTDDVTVYARFGFPITIKYDTQSERIIPTITIASGTSLEESQLHVLYHNGRKVEGWYTDAAYTQKVIAKSYHFDTDTTLYAKWIKYSDSDFIDDGFVLVEGTLVDFDSSLYAHTSYGCLCPENKDEIISDFFIDPYEVTQALYSEVMGENPSRFKGNCEDGEVQERRPVESVSWYDAIYFCNKLSIMKGLEPCYKVDGDTDVNKWGYTPHKQQEFHEVPECDFGANGYRLPLDKEWEYAGRGGHVTAPYFVDSDSEFAYVYSGATKDDDGYHVDEYYFDEHLDSVGWYWYNMATHGETLYKRITQDGKDMLLNYKTMEEYKTPDRNQKGYGTHEVGKKAPNALGLYDMSGNVWEYIYSQNSDVYRFGGCWNTEAWACQVSYYSSVKPKKAYDGNGIRLVRTAR